MDMVDIPSGTWPKSIQIMPGHPLLVPRRLDFSVACGLEIPWRLADRLAWRLADRLADDFDRIPGLPRDVYPLVMTNRAMENHHVYWVYHGISTISMVIFHSSVNSPEGS